MGVALRLMNGVLMLAQLAVAGAIIGLTAARLNTINVKFDAKTLAASVTGTCLLGSAPNGMNLCYAAYGFSGVSVAATGVLALLRCCTCRMCGLSWLFDVAFAAGGSAWWALAGLMFTSNFMQPPTSTLPEAETRQWVLVLAWAGCALFALALLVNVGALLARCCCCGGSDKKQQQQQGGKAVDVERGGSMMMMPMKQPPSPQQAAATVHYYVPMSSPSPVGAHHQGPGGQQPLLLGAPPPPSNVLYDGACSSNPAFWGAGAGAYPQAPKSSRLL